MLQMQAWQRTTAGIVGILLAPSELLYQAVCYLSCPSGMMNSIYQDINLHFFYWPISLLNKVLNQGIEAVTKTISK